MVTALTSAQTLRSTALDVMFHPQSVALVGASDRVGTVGATVLANLRTGPAARRLYCINPMRKEIDGLPCYPSLGELPEPVDLVVIATPAVTVPGLVRAAVEAAARSIVVISAGFRERGAEGVALERQIADALQGSGVALVGPNCLGIMNPANGLNATFADSIALPGSVAFISQSGALCTAILDWSFEERVGFSAFVSTGSMLDVRFADLIRYFGDDPHTKSILLYIESITDAPDFLAAARSVSPRKPIIAIKAGRTQAASKAASSHTGAMAGNDEVMDAAFRACGVLRVDRIADLFYMAETLSKQPCPTGPRLTIVTNAGGPGVLATDALIATGGVLAELDSATIDRLNQILPPHWSHANPIDILGDADAKRYAHALAIAAADPQSDGLLAILAPQGMTDPTDCAKALVPYARTLGKPVIASWMGGPAVSRSVDVLNAANIPTFSYPDTAAQAFTYMWEFTRLQQTLQPSLAETPPVAPPAAAKQIIADALATQRVLLTEFESKQLLASFGIPTVATNLATSAAAAVAQAHAIGFPVVLKLHSTTITHKSDVGGVQLDLNSDATVTKAYDAIQRGVAAEHFAGVTIQPMLRLQGYELILGSTTDPQFGPVILFGYGGQLTEVFRDTALALAPLTLAAAEELVARTRILKALQGTRGRKPVALPQLYQMLVRFSQMLQALPQIAECDINPLHASADGFIALDARVLLRSESV